MKLKKKAHIKSFSFCMAVSTGIFCDSGMAMDTIFNTSESQQFNTLQLQILSKIQLLTEDLNQFKKRTFFVEYGSEVNDVLIDQLILIIKDSLLHLSENLEENIQSNNEYLLNLRNCLKKVTAQVPPFTIDRFAVIKPG